MPVPGGGTLWMVGDGQAPENFTTVAGAGDIAVNDKVIQVDGTSQDSPGHRKQMFSVQNDVADVTVPLFFDPLNEQHIQLQTDKNDFTARNYLLRWNTNPPVYWKFADTQVTDMSVNAPVANLIKGNGKFTCNGGIDYAFTP